MLDETGGDVVKYLRGINLLFMQDIYGNTNYYLYNAHGDVVRLIDTGGGVVRIYDYDAFGVERDPDEYDTNPWRYCGEYWDAETGTVYLRARYYDPVRGRFTQQDEWGYADPTDPLSLNLYTYCGGDPVNYWDPSGHDVAGLLLELQAALGLGAYANIGVYVDDNFNLMIAGTIGGQIQFNGSASASFLFIYDPNLNQVSDALGWNFNVTVDYTIGPVVVGGSVGLGMSDTNKGISAYGGKSGVGIALAPVTYAQRCGYTGQIMQMNLLDSLGLAIGTRSSFDFLGLDATIERLQEGLLITVGNEIIKVKVGSDSGVSVEYVGNTSSGGGGGGRGPSAMQQ